MTVTHEETTLGTGVDEVVEEKSEDPKLRHIFSPPENTHAWRLWMETAQDLVDYAIVNGIELVALCGARVVPVRAVTAGLETCGPCLDEMSRIQENL